MPENRASIQTPIQHHMRFCRGPRLNVEEWGEPGDVRRCIHGRIMLAYEVMGTIPPYWRTLSPIFNPIAYRRARRALRPFTALTATPAQMVAYDVGYEEGGNNTAADWWSALDEVMPSGTNITPSSVAAYIERLQAQEHR